MSEFHTAVPEPPKNRRSRLALYEAAFVLAGVALVVGFVWHRGSESRRLFGLANSPSAAERIAVAEELAGDRGKKALALLDALLADREPGVRMAAARALVKSLREAAAGRLVAAVGTDRLPPAAAEDLLADLGPPAVQALTAYQPSEDLRRACASLLARVGDRLALDPRVFGLAESDPAERGSADLALRQLDRGAEPLLRAGLAAATPEIAVRSAALLSRLGLEPDPAVLFGRLPEHTTPELDAEIASLVRSLKPPPVAWLVQQAGSAAPAARVRAIRLAGLLRAREAAPVLGAAVSDPAADPAVRAAAALALAEIGDPAGMPPLLAALRGEPGIDGAWLSDTAPAEGLPPPPAAAFVRALARFGDAVVAPALEALAADPSFETNARALVVHLGPAAVPTLLGELENGDGSRTPFALHCLGAIGDPRAIGPLMGRLCVDWAAVDGDVAGALAAIGEPAFVPLASACQSDDAGQRACGLEALTEWAKVAAAKPGTSPDDRPSGLMAAALADPDAGVRVKAVAGLGALEARHRWRSVLPLLGDPDAAVRAETVRTVARLGDGPQVPSALSWAARDASADVRIAAFGAIGERKEASAANAVVAGLGDDETAWAAQEALRRLGADGIAAIEQGTIHASPAVRAQCATLLGELGGEAAAGHLEIGIGDSEPSVRAAAVRAVGSVGGKGALARMASVARDPAPEVRAALAAALGTWARPEGLGLLLPLFRDEAGFVRAAAVEAVANMPGPEAIGPLVSLLSDEEIEGPPLARALVAIGAPAVEPLIDTLAGGDMGVRSSRVLEALGGLRDRRATPAVLAFLQAEERPELRADAIRALGSLGDPAAVPPLIDIAAAPYENIAILEPAIDSLGQLQDARATPALASLLATDDDHLCLKAATALESIGGDAASGALRGSAGRLAVVAGAYRFFMSAGGHDDALGEALDTFGGTAMAEAFLNSGNAALSERARAWAEANGYTINWQIRTFP
jgi:HEAT repeat protein